MNQTDLQTRMINSLINLVANVVEFFLLLRIILKLFAASPRAPFVYWVYETTEPLLAPFMGMFPASKITGSFVIEFSSIFALVVYAFLAYLIREVLNTIIHFAKERDMSSAKEISSKNKKPKSKK